MHLPIAYQVFDIAGAGRRNGEVSLKLSREFQFYVEDLSDHEDFADRLHDSSIARLILFAKWEV